MRMQQGAAERQGDMDCDGGQSTGRRRVNRNEFLIAPYWLLVAEVRQASYSKFSSRSGRGARSCSAEKMLLVVLQGAAEPATVLTWDSEQLFGILAQQQWRFAKDGYGISRELMDTQSVDFKESKGKENCHDH